MKRIFELQVDMMPALNKIYPHIKIYNSSTLLKVVSSNSLEYVIGNVGKQIDKVVLPKEIYQFWFKKVYCYTEEWQKGFLNLLSFQKFEQNFSDKEILIFYRNLLNTCSVMHKQGVMSGDMWYDNILINEHLDYRFIDFDLRAKPLFIGYYGYLFKDQHDFSEQVMISDKMSLLSMILYSMKYGNFEDCRIQYPILNFSDYGLPSTIENKFLTLMECHVLPIIDDYFLEELDTLIGLDYKLPY